MKATIKRICLIYLVGHLIYPNMEIVWGLFLGIQGKSFLALFVMGILGGKNMLLLGLLNEIPSFKRLLNTVWKQCLAGGFIITTLELLTGVVVNLIFHLAWWSYESMPLNFMGQICLPYSILWTLLSPIAFWIDDIIRTMDLSSFTITTLLSIYRSLFTLSKGTLSVEHTAAVSLLNNKQHRTYHIKGSLYFVGNSREEEKYYIMK